jgi:hypothetical protein
VRHGTRNDWLRRATCDGPGRRRGTSRGSVWLKPILRQQFTQHLVHFTSADYNEEMKTVEKLTLTLHKTKDTKNKVVYGTKDGDVIQSVYIDKDALGDVPPATLQVVISPQ